MGESMPGPLESDYYEEIGSLANDQVTEILTTQAVSRARNAHLPMPSSSSCRTAVVSAAGRFPERTAKLSAGGSRTGLRASRGFS